MLHDYELTFIITPLASEDTIKALIDRVSQAIVNQGGTIRKINPWGRRRLAYPIQKHRDGYYVIHDFRMATSGVVELERVLKVTEDIIRHLVIAREPRQVAAQVAAEAAQAAQAAQRAAQQGHAEPAAATAADQHPVAADIDEADIPPAEDTTARDTELTPIEQH